MNLQRSDVDYVQYTQKESKIYIYPEYPFKLDRTRQYFIFFEELVISTNICN